MTSMELLNEINRLNTRVADLENTVKVLVDAFSRSNNSQCKINDKIISSLDDVATMLAKHSKRLDALELSKDNEKENSQDKDR